MKYYLMKNTTFDIFKMNIVVKGNGLIIKYLRILLYFYLN